MHEFLGSIPNTARKQKCRQEMNWTRDEGDGFSHPVLR
jgi:hypothetical protein